MTENETIFKTRTYDFFLYYNELKATSTLKMCIHRSAYSRPAITWSIHYLRFKVELK